MISVLEREERWKGGREVEREREKRDRREREKRDRREGERDL